MGAVQKLATVVIIGLVALATVLVVYLADEPNRRGGEVTDQEATSIERGTDLYITYCLQCHGPAGLGREGGEDPARIGAPLNQGPLQEPEKGWPVTYQSDDPVKQSLAEDFLRYQITYGIPADPRQQTKVMPAFGQDLNVEEMNELIYLIMHGDWNYVYNTAVTRTGQAVASQECQDNPDGKYCGNLEEAPPAYPTVPPSPEATEADAASPAADQGESGAAATIEAQDVAFSTDKLSVKPGDTIEMTNVGVLEHDFVVDELGVKEVANGGESVTISIPADAKPGDYKFYCSVPGHEAAGMVGTLTIEG